MARRKPTEAGANDPAERETGQRPDKEAGQPAQPAEKEAGQPAAPGRFSYEGLDRVMHEKARLGILASLAANASGLLFNDLKELCSLTDGNLNRHLAVLNEAELVEVWKGAQSGRQQTMYRLTEIGRQRFTEYISVLESIVSDAQLEKQSPPLSRAPKTGWSPA